MESLANSSRALDPPDRFDPASSSLDDGRVVAALEEYLGLRRDGKRPNRSEFLARHAEIADVLADCIDGLEFVQSAAAEASAAPAPTAAIETLSPATRLGDFRVVREVARGGMGVVYEAEQVSLGRRVALKVLPSAASLDPRHRQRFQVEAQAAALLHHAHIVPVFGVGCEQGVHYYAMQFIEGRSLADLIDALQHDASAHLRTATAASPQRTDGHRTPRRNGHGTTATHRPPEGAGSQGRGPIPHSSTVGGPRASKGRPAEAPASSPSARTRRHCRLIASYGLQAAEALEHAHGVGVLHRDIKPSNLMVDHSGHLWVTDFGLARIPTDPGLTRTGDLVGTLRYMSPEQVRGDRGGIETRTDLYALGVTLYELLALKPAFESPNRERLLQRILHEEPVPPRKLNPSIPRDLETIVLKAMAKEPAGRYGSAREMADDLARFLDDSPILARRPNLLERSVRWARRHRTVVTTAVTVLLIALTIGTLLLWRAKTETDEALKDLQAAQNRETMAFKRTFNAMDIFTLPLMKKAYEAGLLGGENGAKLHANAAHFYDDIVRHLSQDGRNRELVAQAKRRSGNLDALFQDPRSLVYYDQSIRLYEEIAAEHPDFIWIRGDLIATLLDHHTALGTFQDHKAPSDLDPLDRAVEVARELLDEEDSLADCFRPGLVIPFNDLAWKLVTETRTTPDTAALAVRLARFAVETRPPTVALWVPPPGALWNTLGAALYRAGDWRGAVEAFERSMGYRSGGDPYDWYFLAMIHHRHGDRERADSWLERSEAWMDDEENPTAKDPILKLLREETASVFREPPDWIAASRPTRAPSTTSRVQPIPPAMATSRPPRPRPVQPAPTTTVGPPRRPLLRAPRPVALEP